MTDIRYGDYLALDSILNAQHPRSPDPNELLFIIQHQTSELWMKLALHELRAARDAIRSDDLPPAFKMLARVSRIMEQLVHAWSVLATMTPSEYSAIRPYLSTSSGFQSWQYREIEFVLGNKASAMLKPHEQTPIHSALQSALDAPSLYDEAILLLADALLPSEWPSARAASTSQTPCCRARTRSRGIATTENRSWY